MCSGLIPKRIVSKTAIPSSKVSGFLVTLCRIKHPVCGACGEYDLVELIWVAVVEGLTPIDTFELGSKIPKLPRSSSRNKITIAIVFGSAQMGINFADG